MAARDALEWSASSAGRSGRGFGFDVVGVVCVLRIVVVATAATVECFECFDDLATVRLHCGIVLVARHLGVLVRLVVERLDAVESSFGGLDDPSARAPSRRSP
jgi:hypothetical protein